MVGTTRQHSHVFEDSRVFHTWNQLHYPFEYDSAEVGGYGRVALLKDETN